MHGRRHVQEEAERRVRRAETRAADAEGMVHRAESEAAELRTAASTAGRKAEDQSAAAQRLHSQVESLQADVEAGTSSHHRQLRVWNGYNVHNLLCWFISHPWCSLPPRPC